MKLRKFLSNPLTMFSIAVVCLALWLTGNAWWIIPFGLVVSALAGYAWKWEGVEEDYDKHIEKFDIEKPGTGIGI